MNIQIQTPADENPRTVARTGPDLVAFNDFWADKADVSDIMGTWEYLAKLRAFEAGKQVTLNVGTWIQKE